MLFELKRLHSLTRQVMVELTMEREKDKDGSKFMNTNIPDW